MEERQNECIQVMRGNLIGSLISGVSIEREETNSGFYKISKSLLFLK